MSMEQEMRAASVAFNSLQRDEYVQVNGMIFLFDMSGVGTKQMARFSSSDMRKWHSFWQVSSVRLTLVYKAVQCLL